MRATAGSDAAGHRADAQASILRQPKAVWAVAFSCVIAFMGIGLVDPILPALASDLHATHAQVELLFTSYFLVTGVSMLVSGAVASWIGRKPTLLIGLALIVSFSAAAGASDTITQIVGFRGGWGFGNALFIATALATIVGASNGGTRESIILYEAALGLGISTGPLLGGALGGISWRGPFFGTAALMAVGFVLVSALLPHSPRPARHTTLLDPFRALRHRGLLVMSVTAVFYNFGFFTLLAYTPLVMKMGAHELGLVFFGWGGCLAITSVFIAPILQRRFGTVPTLYAVLAALAVILAAMGPLIDSPAALAVLVIVAGLFLGVNNTLITQAVMGVATMERGVASAAYSFVRFTGGGTAPWLAGLLSAWASPHVPFYVGALALSLAIAVLFSGRKALRGVDAEEQVEAIAEDAEHRDRQDSGESTGQDGATADRARSGFPC